MQILAVVVLYKRTLEESQTIHSLVKVFGSHPELLDSIGVLVWDNSPAPLVQPELPFPFEYRHSSQNVGVSGAYNRALEIAEGLLCPWMLLLDQDTILADEYLDKMLAYSRQLEGNPDIGAIAPFLFDGKQAISPQIIRFYGIQLVPPGFSGIHSGELYAANSGTLMRAAALKEAGGYNEQFWLDYSDIVAFHRLFQRGKRLYVAGDLQLQHEITCNDYDGLMSPERYRNFMTAENAYCDLYRSFLGNAIQTLRLLARAIRQYRAHKRKEFSRITLEYFCRRIFSTKRQRLSRWRQPTNRDLPVIAEGRAIG